MIKYRHQITGFTLVEVMVALLIISVSIFGITQLHARVYSLSSNNADQIYAALLVNEITETVRNFHLSNPEGIAANEPNYSQEFITAGTATYTSTSSPPSCDYNDSGTAQSNVRIFAQCVTYRVQRNYTQGVVSIVSTTDSTNDFLSYRVSLSWVGRLDGRPKESVVNITL